MMQRINIKYALSAAVLSAVLNGCSLFSDSSTADSKRFDPCLNNQAAKEHCDDPTAYAEISRGPTSDSVLNRVSTAFSPIVHFQTLNDYVEQMSLDLSRELIDVKLENPIAVSSFVHLDSTLNHADVLGNQLAEAFIAELRKMGLLVNDHKVSGQIMVTSTGDFALSRDAIHLKASQNIGYVLTGTLIKNAKGVMVNARIVGLNDNIVVAATSKLIPNIMLDEF